MTDINKQIEKEAREYSQNTDICPTLYEYDDINNQYKDGIETAFLCGYKSALHSSRWRKVSEGMPESGEDVLAKCECGSLEVSFKGEMSGRIVCNCEGCDNIVEWKPID